MRSSRFWILLFVLIALSTCQKDRPLPTGYETLFGDREGQIATTVIPTSFGSETGYSRVINTGNGYNLLIGNYQNYRLAIYLKFDKLPDSALVHQAKLSLRSNTIDSTLLSTNSVFDLAIYRADFQWDSDLDPEAYLDQLPFQGPYLSIATVSPDSIGKIVFELDRDLVTDWADTTTGTPNHGIWMISPNLAGLRSFYSVENADATVKPQLSLIYTPKDSAASVRDTTIVTASADAFLVVNPNEALSQLDPDFIYVGKGLVFRSFVQFDLSQLDSTTQINRALLKMVINSGHSFPGKSAAAETYILRKAEASTMKGEIDENPSTSAFTGTLSDSTLIFDVTSVVQGWLNNNFPNYGFLVRSLNEGQSLARVAFYSSKSNAIDLKPRLELYYTTPAKQEF